VVDIDVVVDAVIKACYKKNVYRFRFDALNVKRVSILRNLTQKLVRMIMTDMILTE
jgi:hypothetical protein